MIDNSKEYIICSAIWYDDGIPFDTDDDPKKLPHHFRGATFQNTNIKTGFVIGQWRHGNVIAIRPSNPRFNRGQHTVQGFLTSKGKFVDRWQASIIAFRCGQIDEDKYINKRYSGPDWTNEQIESLLNETPTERHSHMNEYPMDWLYSEDIY